MKSFIEFIQLQEVISPEHLMSNIPLWINNIDNYVKHLEDYLDTVQNLNPEKKGSIEKAINSLIESATNLGEITNEKHSVS
jgi:hypothetical protein